MWRLDRLGRSLKHLIDTITELDQEGVAFRSLTESLDTSSTGGKLVFHIFGALAELERECAGTDDAPTTTRASSTTNTAPSPHGGSADPLS